jgi:N-hydroxyarylamine O-acetyltransferase
MDQALLEDVLHRLGIARSATGLDDLRLIYAAWCEAVPFDNVQKMIHIAESRDGPLPGSTAEDFFGSWLTHRTGGTCWAGNGALHDLLAALGFEVERAVATMLPSATTVSPNHGSVLVALGGGRWITDASILSGEPLRVTAPDTSILDNDLPRLEWRDGKPNVIWRSLSVPQGFPCRFERIGVGADEWDALHQRTAVGGPFNTALSARVLRSSMSIGFTAGQRFAFDANGTLTVEERDREGRDRFLAEELGISASLVARLPDDQPLDA